VLFELGARWGAKRSLLPVVALADKSVLKEPLKSKHAGSLYVSGDIHNLLSEVSRQLGKPLDKVASYEKYVQALIRKAKPRTERRKKTASEAKPTPISASTATSSNNTAEGPAPSQDNLTSTNEISIARLLEQQRMQQVLAAQPYFRGSGGSYTSDSGEFKLKNKGGAIKNLSFQWPGEIRGTVRPTPHLDKEEEISINVDHLPTPLPRDFPVVIHYEDMFGNKRSKLIRYIFDQRQWVEDDWWNQQRADTS
jgi:hypothetical protein